MLGELKSIKFVKLYVKSCIQTNTVRRQLFRHSGFICNCRTGPIPILSCGGAAVLSRLLISCSARSHVHLGPRLAALLQVNLSGADLRVATLRPPEPIKTVKQTPQVRMKLSPASKRASTGVIVGFRKGP